MGLQKISQRAPHLWNVVALEIIQSLSLSTFKEKIKM